MEDLRYSCTILDLETRRRWGIHVTAALPPVPTGEETSQYGRCEEKTSSPRRELNPDLAVRSPLTCRLLMGLFTFRVRFTCEHFLYTKHEENEIRKGGQRMAFERLVV
jgi:hypothetical protein